ncbi:EF-hand domain-containing protein [Acetobacter pasteurianus]|uniref:EF-hand domain-containing protein n=1 Tax=Acetobacter pasteurianus TaxID=438 RepID=UPI00286B1A68|nr:EF-hand domain-containing protein [Acetobacter pasteurianus]WKC16518.1 EF-hand domain-containing protein [Acetobacter pasteurianus]
MQADISAKRKHHFTFPKYLDFPLFLNVTLCNNVLRKIFVLSVIIFNFYPEKLYAETAPNTYSEQDRQKDFNDADTNHDGCLSFDEFNTEVRKILSSRDDFSSRGFAMLPISAQDAVLNDEFHKMDHGQKGYLNVNDWQIPE